MQTKIKILLSILVHYLQFGIRLGMSLSNPALILQTFFSGFVLFAFSGSWHTVCWLCEDVLIITCAEQEPCCPFGPLHRRPRSSLFAGRGATGAANEERGVGPSSRSTAHNIMVELVWAQTQDLDKRPGCHGQPVCTPWLQAGGEIYVRPLRARMGIHKWHLGRVNLSLKVCVFLESTETIWCVFNE